MSTPTLNSSRNPRRLNSLPIPRMDAATRFYRPACNRNRLHDPPTLRQHPLDPTQTNHPSHPSSVSLEAGDDPVAAFRASLP
jgi:hypothetical protein